MNEAPDLLLHWKTPWYVRPDGVMSADGFWICSPGNSKLAHQLVDLANYAASLRVLSERPAAAPSETVQVKPLEWEIYAGEKLVGEQREHYGFHELGYYVATKSDDAWSVGTFTNRGKTRFVGFYGTLADAKAAAQADYEQRILSALTHPPMRASEAVAKSHDKAVEVARKIWLYFRGQHETAVEAGAWFDNHKTLGGPAYIIDLVRSAALAKESGNHG